MPPTEQRAEQYVQKYAACPKEQTEYEFDGKKYAVTRHFTGEKKIGEAVVGLAIRRADREEGLLHE